jgi:hypothetical protein
MNQLIIATIQHSSVSGWQWCPQCQATAILPSVALASVLAILSAIASKAFHALDVWSCRKVSFRSLQNSSDISWYIIESYLQLAITQKLPLLSSWRMLEKGTESVAQWHRKRALRCCVHLRQWSLQLWLQWCLCGSKSSVFIGNSGKFWKRKQLHSE